MKRTHSLIYRSQIKLVVCAALMCLAFPSQAELDQKLEKEFQQTAQAAQSAYDQALAVKQAITDFTYKRNINDESTELVIYVSLTSTAEQPPQSVSVEIKLGGSQLALKNYDSKAVSSLLRGTSHRIFVGNIPQGSHDLMAHIKEETNGKNITSHSAIRFHKSAQSKVYELTISASENDIPPEIVFLDHS